MTDLRQEIALALNSHDDGCWSGEPCCWVSLDHAMPVVEAHLAAAWDECVQEAYDGGHVHDAARDELLARNPHRVTS